ncbi:hypothetical protein IOL78_003836 [Salmonella enterica]|nr:hypothetical protein [Salmonella enterica]EII4381911.1 hypothetical protein [Salmonella enterica]
MIKRLKQMEMHYSQLDPDNKKKVQDAIDNLDDLIEALLLEQTYNHDAKFIKEYSKHYNLQDIKKDDRRNRTIVVHSRTDGLIKHTNKKADLDKAVMKAVYEQRQRETNISKIMAGGK